MTRASTSLLLLALVCLPMSTNAQSGPGFERGMQIAFGMPRIAAANLYLSRAMVVEAVYQATVLSGAATMGQVANTGTLSPGYGGAFQHSPQPSDRLVVHYAGQVHEFVVHEAVGNPQALTSDQWLLSPHQLRYSHRLGDLAEAEISVRFDGASFETDVTGWTTQWDRRYEMSLQSTGRTGGVRDFDGQDIQTTYTLVGQIEGDGLSLLVNEQHTSSLVSAQSLRLLPSQRGAASQSTAQLANALTLDGAVYQMQDVRVEMGTQARGGQGSAGTTGLTGVLLRDNTQFGTFALQGGRPFLTTPSGVVTLDGLGGAQ